MNLFFVLIESDWNLKITLQLKIIDLHQRINRIRLEFKVVSSLFNVVRLSLVLIESDWNLKNCSTGMLRLVISVLIESDWNLKIFSAAV